MTYKNFCIELDKLKDQEWKLNKKIKNLHLMVYTIVRVIKSK